MGDVYFKFVDLLNLSIPIGVLISQLKQVILLLDYYKIEYDLKKLETYLIDYSNLYTKSTILEYFCDLLKELNLKENSKEFIDILVCINSYEDDEAYNFTLDFPKEILEKLSVYKLESYNMSSNFQIFLDEFYDFIITYDIIDFFYKDIWSNLIVKSIITSIKEENRISFCCILPFYETNLSDFIQVYDVECNNALGNAIFELQVFFLANGINSQLAIDENINAFVLSFDI